MSRYLFKWNKKWCDILGLRNPYLDNYDHHLTPKMVTNDVVAYKTYPRLRHIYDKLWVAQSQNVQAGDLSKIEKDIASVKFPIFIKPRYGHLTACSRNCHKIENASQLARYRQYKDMMWSSYIDGKEGMTDYMLLDGNIVHQLTYDYSAESRGNVEVYKHVSPTTKPRGKITEWVKKHLPNHTGFVNVQERDGTIIEVGLRPARSGAYHILADNPAISRNVYNLFHKKTWEHGLDMSFKPYYSFKCLCRLPVITLIPDKLVSAICSMYPGVLLHEYYFEPVHGKGMIVIHFAHRDKEVGNKARKQLEAVFEALQFATIALLLLIPALLVLKKAKLALVVFAIILVLFAGRFLNPLTAQIQLWRAQREIFQAENSMVTQEEFDVKHQLRS